MRPYQTKIENENVLITLANVTVLKVVISEDDKAKQFSIADAIAKKLTFYDDNLIMARPKDLETISEIIKFYFDLKKNKVFQLHQVIKDAKEKIKELTGWW